MPESPFQSTHLSWETEPMGGDEAQEFFIFFLKVFPRVEDHTIK